jgi:hypothetical protein
MNMVTLHSTELLENVTGVTTFDSPGERLIIIHTGGSMDFITGAQIVHEAKSISSDLHQTINSVNYEK